MSTTKNDPPRSRLNAVKHGLRATDELLLAHLKTHERQVFEEFRVSLHEEYKPLTTQEKLLVDQLALQHYRLFRLYDLEYTAVNQSQKSPLAPESIVPHLDRFSRYDTRVEKQIRILHNRLRSFYANRNDFSLNFLSAKE